MEGIQDNHYACFLLVFAISFLHLDAITMKVNWYDSATFGIIKTFQLVIIFASLDHNNFDY